MFMCPGGGGGAEGVCAGRTQILLCHGLVVDLCDLQVLTTTRRLRIPRVLMGSSVVPLCLLAISATEAGLRHGWRSRPAALRLGSPCMTEHGIRDDPAAGSSGDWDGALREVKQERMATPRATPSPVRASNVKPASPPSFDVGELIKLLVIQFVISVRASTVQAAQDTLRLRSMAREEELRRRAYIEPRESWTPTELAAFDGTSDPEGPILMAADGLVYNVGGVGARFYGPGGEYHCFAGRDATRLLAKQRTEEETADELAVPLSLAEKLVLSGWILVLKRKYVVVGPLKSP
eukprot:scaffold178211_cov32-Tisochrysis_lutea.AAC.1